MSGTFGDFDAIIGARKFAPDPFLVLDAQRSLGCDLLSEKTVCGSCWNSSRRRVRLVEKTTVLQIRHDIANGGRAERFLEALGNSTRRDGLACLDIRTDKVRQNLPVAPFLEECVSHSSTHARGVLTTIVGSLSSSGQSLPQFLGCRSSRPTACYAVLTSHLNPHYRSARAAICLSSRCTASSTRYRSRWRQSLPHDGHCRFVWYRRTASVSRLRWLARSHKQFRCICRESPRT